MKKADQAQQMKAAIDDLSKIEKALIKAGDISLTLLSKGVKSSMKTDKTIVTEADYAVDKLLRYILPVENDEWLSEETADNKDRLNANRVWVVDPIDGTIEFAKGIPHWTISIGLVLNGIPVAGGIYNPQRNQLFLGAIGLGVKLNGKKVNISRRKKLEGCTVSVSNTEYKRGEWDEFQKLPIDILPCGSTAYKLARVAAGLDDASLSFGSKKEWDIAAGFCLIHAAGGLYVDKNGNQNLLNQFNVSHDGFIVGPESIVRELVQLSSDKKTNPGK